MDNLIQDLRYGFRMMLKRPGFTAVAVMTLALGIGANSAIFTIVNAVLLRALPYQEPERLMLLRNAPAIMAGPPTARNQATLNTVLPWRDQVESFQHLAAYGDLGSGVNLTGDPEPERVTATDVNASFFSTVGVEASLGRTFLAEEEEAGKSQVAVISYGLWQRRFGSDPNLIGQPLALNGKSFTVIGVAPSGFQYPDTVDVWIPIQPMESRIFTEAAIHYSVIGRLKPEVSPEQAEAELAVLFEPLKEQYPHSFPPNRAVAVIPLLDEMVKDIRLTILMLLGAVGFVLLIACANVTNLLLARAAARQKEIAIRTALGAGRARLIRQLLVESLLLALAGGALGLLVALWGVDLLVALSPAGIPRLNEVSLDNRVFGFTLSLSLLTGILFGLAPALQTSKIDLRDSLKEGAARLKVGFGYRSIRSLLVVSEVALALVLLIGAGLLIKSFLRLNNVSPGFDPHNVLTATISLPNSKYPKPANKTEFFKQAIERLRAVPGVESVGAVNSLPFGGGVAVGLIFNIEGRPVSEPDESDFSESDFSINLVTSADYFRVLKIPVIQGRYFTEQDTSATTPVILINQAMARRYWPDEDPIGKRINLVSEKAPREIIGVVGDVKQFGLQDSSKSIMYVSYLQTGWTPSTLVVRTESDPLSFVSALRSEIHALDADLPLYNIKGMEQRISDSTAQRRFTLLLVAIFAALALLLAGVGIYGVMSHSVAQRTREIGIRMALGAQPGQVMKLIMRKGLALTIFGVAIGLAAAVALTRMMSSLLYGVSATDLSTFTIISLLLATVALVACYVPARRAMNVDPMVALRHE